MPRLRRIRSSRQLRRADASEASGPPLPPAAPAPPNKRRRGLVRKHLQDRSFGDIAMLIKGVIVVTATVVPVVLASIVVGQAMLETGVMMTNLRVPQGFERLGYAPETATQRLLDEIALLNRSSIAAKPKTTMGDTQIIDALSEVETPAGNLDLRSIQSLIQRVFGKQIIQISGEITQRLENGVELTRLRLRQTPGRDVLIDVETSRGADDLFKRAALNLLERVDPEIAAGIYWREYGDEDNARRLIAITLSGGHPAAEKYAFNLQAYLQASRGQFDDAMASSDRARQLDPSFAAADYSRSFTLMMAKRYDEALESANAGVARDPTSFNSYNSLGLVLDAMGRKEAAVEAFKTAISLNRTNFVSYRRLAAVLRDLGRRAEAETVLFNGVSVIPTNAGLMFDFGDEMMRKGKITDAIRYLKRAQAIQPDNLRVMIALAEAEKIAGHLDEAQRLGTIIRSRLEAGEDIPKAFRDRATVLLAKLPAETANAKP